MHKVYILCIACGIMFCATSTLAQLSANPWVDANTKEQIDEVYKKYQRRGYKDNSLEYVEESEIVIENSKKHIEELEEQEEPSFKSQANKLKINMQKVQEQAPSSPFFCPKCGKGEVIKGKTAWRKGGRT